MREMSITVADGPAAKPRKERIRRVVELADAATHRIASCMTDDEMDEAWAELRHEELCDD